ncbi:hypothetical protein [Streptomyces sp. NPDC006270]|uniref:hypothetical protein n=1 Tax=Streptomyces sp. NPDC006270 TaxID=3364741 RepID=UPI0036A40392
MTEALLGRPPGAEHVLVGGPRGGSSFHAIGTGLERQLRPHADDLVGHHLQDRGHIIPLDRPDALYALLAPFLSADLPE